MSSDPAQVHRATIPPMSSTRLWDRAASLPLPVDGRHRPELASPARGPAGRRHAVHVRPRRRAPLRDAADADRGVGVHGRRRAPDDPRHRAPPPGPGQGDHDRAEPSGPPGTTSCGSRTARPSGPTRPSTSSARTGRSGGPVVGLEDRDLPGMSTVYRPLTALPMETLPDTFVHPAGFCQNVLATGALLGLRHDRDRRSRGDRARLRPPADDRDPGRPARSSPAGGVRPRDRGHRPAARDDRRGHDPRRDRVDLGPDAPLPPATFQFCSRPGRP